MYIYIYVHNYYSINFYINFYLILLRRFMMLYRLRLVFTEFQGEFLLRLSPRNSPALGGPQ